MAGRLRNNGTEMGLTLLPIQTATFTWQSRTTYSRNRGLVTVASSAGVLHRQRLWRAHRVVESGSQGYAPDEVVAYEGFDTAFVNGVYSSARTP